MKFQFLVLPIVALLPLRVMAQAPAQAPALTETAAISMEPAAQAILERAVETYKGASGLSFNTSTLYEGKGRLSSQLVRYSRPGKLRIDRVSRKKTYTQLYDGRDHYNVAASTYRVEPAPLQGDAPMTFGRAGYTAEMIGAMLAGKNYLADQQKTMAGLPLGDYLSRVVALGPRLVDGDMLVGVQETAFHRYDRQGQGTSEAHMITTSWFGGSPFALRRVQQRLLYNGQNIRFTERISDQQFSPTFPEGTFVFDGAGLILEEKEDPNAPLYDPRLKVGAVPFPIATQDMQGRWITLSQYKGKVLLIDFWATWCSPCVAALPEVEKVYKKYHAKGLQVVSISLDEEKSDLTSFLKKHKLPWTQVFDGKAWKTKPAVDYGVKAIPFMLIIGKDGKIAAIDPQEKLDAAVKAALAAR
ncbi:redoxin domain-containing protein [bacterium]|nr:MAG: redoxin domain-containing protein [bacterium]